VTVGKYTTVGAAAGALVARMAKTTALMRGKLYEYIDRGEILQSEMTALELQAKLAQIGAGGSPQIAVDDYPAPMRDLFYKHVAQEATRLEAAIRLAAVQRELAVKEQEYRAGLLAVQNSKMAGYLVSLLPQWSVRGMQLRQLREAAARYAEDTRYYLRPILKLWHPAVFASMASRVEVQILTDVDVDSSTLDMMTTLAGLGDELHQQLTNPFSRYPSPDDTAPVFVALRFPKESVLDPACADSPSARCRRRLDVSTYRWATVAATKKLWRSLGSPADGVAMRRLEFKIDPEDLYERLAGSEYLPCTKALPVVRKIGLALTGYPTNGVPSERRGIDAEIPEDATMSFIDAAGEHSFTMANPAWRHIAVVPLVYTNTNYGKVKADFAAIPQDVRGVSPFTTFVFDIPESTVVEWKIREAETIDLILEVEAVRGNDAVALPKCSTARQLPLLAPSAAFTVLPAPPAAVADVAL
jgi:hypothetical protein